MPDYVGRVIEFVTAGTPRLGFVTAETKNRFQVTDQNGRQHSVAAKQIRVLFTDECTPTVSLTRLKDLDAELEKIQESVDTELLWESIEKTGQPLDPKGLAEIYFGESTPEHEAALYRALLRDSIRFRARGTSLVARTPEQVQERLLAESRKLQREEARKRSLEWAIEALAEGQTEPADPETESLLHRVEDFLLNRRDNHIQSWLTEVADHFPERDLEARETACRLLIVAGKLPPDTDPFLIETGIDQRFPEAVQREANELQGFRADAGTVRCFQENVLSIDDEDTVEIDDGLSVEETGEGLRVGIHIADVSYFVRRDSNLDKEAFRRSASIYLPHCCVRMLPDRLSCDLASLREGEARPSLSFLVRFDRQGELADWSIHHSCTIVSRRLSYDDADRMLSENTEDGIARSLRLLSGIAEKLRSKRRSQGAITIPRPELKITANDGQIRVKTIDPLSPSRQLVSELMILANHLIASYATDQKVPLIFRTQAAPSEALPPIESYDPFQAHLIFSKLEPGKLSLTPDSHFGLGLDRYTQSTSPIRRFTDLVLQRQIVSHLGGDPLPYSPEELMEILGAVQSVEAQIRSVERRANRLFALRYLSQQRIGEMEAVVIKRIMGGFLVETKELFLRGRLQVPGELEPGQSVAVRVKKLDPDRNLLVFSC